VADLKNFASFREDKIEKNNICRVSEIIAINELCVDCDSGDYEDIESYIED
jgi:hypothetical protein